MGETIVTIRDLHLQFRTYAGVVHALNGVELEICQGDMLGLVGETGCGKSMIGLALLGLVPKGGEIVSGSITFKGEELLDKSDSYLGKIRGAQIAMIFQDPGASLNPLYTIGEQMGFIMRKHQPASKSDTHSLAVDLLRMVELPDPERILETYPHELSGGMRQRACIAMALSCGAELLIADEPTTDLDVTVQAQILDLLRRLRETQGITVLMITHDLAVVAEMCQRVAVLYAGRVLESGPVQEVLYSPKHPYTQALLNASPSRSRRGSSLQAIPGTVPSGLNPVEGCAFGPRCRYRTERCEQAPRTITVGHEHTASCFLYAESVEQ